jgi:ribosomal protein L11 methyltransferase
MAACVETGQVPRCRGRQGGERHFIRGGTSAWQRMSLSATSLRPETTLYQASIVVPADSADEIAAALETAESPAATAVTLFDHGGGRFEVSAYYTEAPCAATLATLTHGVAGAAGIGHMRIEPLADSDWVTLSQAMRGPVQAGRFLVHGSHDRGRIARRTCTIEIDAGQAFGTAHHASTRGCLLALDRLLKPGLLNHGHRLCVVDIGTGSGILAIAAAKTFKGRVLASDCDGLAVSIATDNARQNGVGARVRVVQAPGLAHPALRRVRPDLLFANLLPRPLLELAPAFASAVRPSGICVLSGLTHDQVPCVEARFRSLGFRLDSRILLDRWATLLLIRHSSRNIRVRD